MPNKRNEKNFVQHDEQQQQKKKHEANWYRLFIDFDPTDTWNILDWNQYFNFLTMN